MSLRRSLTRPIRYAALVAGAVPVLAFPAPNLEYLAWFGLVPGLLIMRAAPTAREAAVRGWWFGAGFMLAAVYWLAPLIGPALLLIAIVFGALWAPVGVGTRALLSPPVSARRALAALVVVPSFWLVIGWARSWQGFGGPWALLGSSQWQHPAVLALASVGGVWLVSFALVLANTALVILLVAPRTAIRVTGAVCAAAALAAGPVVFALTPPARPQRFITVALVQPGLIHNPALRADASERMSRALASRHPGLIVWGESSIAVDLHHAPGLLARLRALSAADGAQILLNQDSHTRRGLTKVAVLVGPAGIEGSYTKTRLVPFGEYIPFRQELGWLTSISRAAPANMVPGTGAHVLHMTLPGGRPLTIGVLICFESAFPDMSRYDTLHGAHMIVYQTSDSTFQSSWEPAQHASLGAVRAAETGRPVVQAALTGDSAAFGARGRLLADMPTSRHGVTFARLGLPATSSLTVYDRIGEVVPWTAVGIAAGSVALALIRSRRPHRPAGILWNGNHRPGLTVSAGEPPAGQPLARQPSARQPPPGREDARAPATRNGATARSPRAGR